MEDVAPAGSAAAEAAAAVRGLSPSLDNLDDINEELLELVAGRAAAAPTRASEERAASLDGLRSYTRLILPSNQLVKRAAKSEETVCAVRMLVEALALRNEYITKFKVFPSPCVLPPLKEHTGELWGSSEPRFCPEAGPILPNLDSSCEMRAGVFEVRVRAPEKLEAFAAFAAERAAARPAAPGAAPGAAEGAADVLDLAGWRHTTVAQYLRDLAQLMRTAQDPVCKSFCYQRNKHLEERYSFHLLFNSPAELEEVRSNCHRDFYNVRKVDTHVHHSACMTQKHLLRFIRRKYRTCGDEPVCFADSAPAPPEPVRGAISEDEGTEVDAVCHRDCDTPLSVGSSQCSPHAGLSAAPSASLVLQMASPRRPNVYGALLGAAPPAPRAPAPSRANPRVLTLKQLFQEELGLTAWEVSIDHLDVHAINSCFHRFDIFNTKYNPFGAARLREVFLKTDNMLSGRYLAELTSEVIEDLEAAKYQQVEWRVSIYGHSADEWLKLARWILNNKLQSRRVRWIIQVPRLYHIYRRRNKVGSMAELLSNVFAPILAAVLRPQDHPEIFALLYQVIGWDSVDDESAGSCSGGCEIPPEQWTGPDNPPYEYWMYYMYENIKALNALLQLRGLAPLPFRPHCGEAGSILNLAAGGLVANNINHGIMLRKSPVLIYLYYLWQIQIAVSPLSNNALFHEIKNTPFHKFFKIGHHLSLSTDDPLMFHFTDESLLEEYSVMTHLYKFTQVDLCELARNSVLQSNFEHEFKQHWLGAGYELGQNNIQATNVPNIRLEYRKQTLAEEYKYLRDILKHATRGRPGPEGGRA